MSATERQLSRLNILKFLCESLNFNPTHHIDNIMPLKSAFPDIEYEDLFGQLSYLRDKAYLTYTPISSANETIPMFIKITPRAIDLIEKLESNMSTITYENDFSQSSLHQFSNIQNSQIVINSPNTNITFTQNENAELIRFLEKLQKDPSVGKNVQTLAANVLQEAKAAPLTKEYLKGIGRAMLSIGTTVLTELMTTQIKAYFGIA